MRDDGKSDIIISNDNNSEWITLTPIKQNATLRLVHLITSDDNPSGRIHSLCSCLVLVT